MGRGCLGRPWLFRDLVDAFAGRPVRPAPLLGEVCTVMRDHAERLVAWSGEVGGMKSFRKHAGWYLTGYPVGGVVKKRANVVATLADLDRIIDELDPDAEIQGNALRGGAGPHERPQAGPPSRGMGRAPATTRRHPRAPSSSSAAASPHRVPDRSRFRWS